MKTKLLHPNHLVYEALHKPDVDGIKENSDHLPCALCGYIEDNIISWKVPANFSDINVFIEKENIQCLCPACQFVLKHFRSLYFNHYIVSLHKGFRFIEIEGKPIKNMPFGSKIQIKPEKFYELLLDLPTDEPYLIMIKSSGNAQHALYHAKVNCGDSQVIYVSHGRNVIHLPKNDLEELIDALIKVKLSSSLYPFLYNDRLPDEKHKEYALWNEIEPVLLKHRHNHYIPFLYNYILPKKEILKGALT